MMRNASCVWLGRISIPPRTSGSLGTPETMDERNVAAEIHPETGSKTDVATLATGDLLIAREYGDI